MSVENFPPELIKTYKEAFRLFDEDHDGVIPPECLGVTIRSLGFVPTNAKIDEIIHQDVRGGITFDNFLEILAKHFSSKPDIEKEMREAFSNLQNERKGYIKCTTLRHLLISIGERLTGDEADQMLHICRDPENPEWVELEHFIQVMKPK
eukprot:TRINITY_DN4490_c0_g2_i2.p1 TRINITY_DN4490_c0_g2~~TRINITY_DN4490_c0_g2_i2.p1  ORF type:complete len:150 (+),score=19.47 TRINITY_DN4490_c0_g2_i2:71-520(+)